MKTYEGNHDLGEGWKEEFELREIYDSQWIVYTKDTDPNGRYLSVKIAASGRVQHKANYWLFWDKQKNKLGSRGFDYKLLKHNRPELHDILARNLQTFA